MNKRIFLRKRELLEEYKFPEITKCIYCGQNAKLLTGYERKTDEAIVPIYKCKKCNTNFVPNNLIIKQHRGKPKGGVKIMSRMIKVPKKVLIDLGYPETLESEKCSDKMRLTSGYVRKTDNVVVPVYICNDPKTSIVPEEFSKGTPLDVAKEAGFELPEIPKQSKRKYKVKAHTRRPVTTKSPVVVTLKTPKSLEPLLQNNVFSIYKEETSNNMEFTFKFSKDVPSNVKEAMILLAETILREELLEKEQAKISEVKNESKPRNVNI